MPGEGEAIAFLREDEDAAAPGCQSSGMSCALPEASGPKGILTQGHEAWSGPFTSHAVSACFTTGREESGKIFIKGGLCFEISIPNFQFWRASGRVGRGLGALGGNLRTPRGPGPAGSLETPEGAPAQRRGWSPAFHLPPPHREARAGQAPREEAVSLALCPRCCS